MDRNTARIDLMMPMLFKAHGVRSIEYKISVFGPSSEEWNSINAHGACHCVPATCGLA